MRTSVVTAFWAVAGTAVMLGASAFAQEARSGKLQVTVSPKQAYTFVDGKAIGPGNRTVKLAVGTHHLVVANYGYKFFEQDISIDSDKTMPMKVDLVSVGSEVGGPRGRIQIEVGTLRVGDAAVFLKGKKTEKFVGARDEIKKKKELPQEFIISPANHQKP